MIERNSMIMMKSFYEAINKAPKKYKLELYETIVKYGLYGTIPDNMSPLVETTFAVIKPIIDNNSKKYDASVENGKKGGRPRKTIENKGKNEVVKKPNKTQRNPEKPRETQRNLTETLNVNLNLNENLNENENYNKRKNTKKEKTFFDSEEINKLFLDFLDLRKNLKVKNTDRAISILLNKLNKYSDETKKRMLEEAIEKSWRSVYPPKDIKQEIIPDWVDKKQEDVVITKEEQKEMEELFKEWQK